MIDLNHDLTLQEIEEIRQKWEAHLKELDKRMEIAKSSEWLNWLIDILTPYSILSDEDVAYNTSWSREDKNKFYIISEFHEYLISIAKTLNIPYINEDSEFENYETNFTYKNKPYHIFTMMGQGVITSIKNGFEDLDKFPPITIDSYYSNN